MIYISAQLGSSLIISMRFFLLLCFLAFAAQAQSQIDSKNYDFDLKIIYQFTHQNDSTSAESKKSLFTQLSIGDKRSQFQTIAKFERDSILCLDPSNMIYHRYGGINPNNFLIEKKEELICVYEPLNGVALSGNNELFYYEQNKEELDWSVTQDTATINQFVCQKATINWGGRSWTAWFAVDIPISEGPYKFCGLPGLIVSISDGDLHFVFDLVSIQKVKHTALSFDKIRSDFKLIKTTKDDFYEERKKLRNNMVGYALLNGDKFNEDQKRNIQESAQKDNNHIEKY
ncbi:GLPGLI family protein [Sphingobacterium olei]|uniref:GLPGLI family protein n=1 Tax=Sphingobacterium olei TaxID=2571155 RepID=A0A4U0N8V9_9SPHI|nr:GLPGLI family protein [Sphingobacterium olei]TJZ50053.1 GLPGLI family protein [Sphingobacterium olei]